MSPYRIPTYCFVLLLAGCALAGPDVADTPPLNTDTPFLLTDRLSYEATVLEEQEWLDLRIPLTYTNHTTQPLYLIGCHRPTMPVLKKWVNGAWVHAYAGIILECWSPPRLLTPGDRFQDTLHVSTTLDPTSNIAPKFTLPIEGTYRLIREVYTQPEPQNDYLLPQEARTSNTFAISSAPR